MQVSKKAQDALGRVTKTVEQSYEYFRKNYERFNYYRRFVFETSLSADDISLLQALKKPQIEFNILEAYISRLRGEFSKQEPSIEVMAGDEEPIDPQTIKVVEGHTKHILCEANKDGCEYNVYSDTLSGGFSVIKVWTEYAHEKSMEQVIRMGRVYDPTLCGFDPMARQPHKGDGNYCFELFPKRKDEFEREYPDVPIDRFKFVRNVGGFNWSYQNNNEDVLLICDFYEKKKKRVKLVQTADGKTMTEDEYIEFMLEWERQGRIEQPPQIIKERKTEIETICRYRFIENYMLEYVETDYKMLPLVFVDGNSILLRDEMGGDYRQMTRPYVYHAKDMQRLKNYAGQCLANELENMVQHKWMAPQEGLPQQEDYLQAWVDPQQASVFIYKAYADDNPEKQLPQPREINRIPIPPEVTNTFTLTDQVAQNILGSFDAALGINDNQLSGIAITEGATQSNSAAMPYVVGFVQALGRVAELIVSLIPKYYKTPRTIPVVGIDGKKDYVKVNQPQGQQQPGQEPVNLYYEENALSVKVEAGVNFQIAKNQALQQIVGLMQASPLFAQFMNTEGLEVLLDNVEIRGVDQLKVMAQQWMEMQRKQAQQAMSQPNPQVMKAQIDAQKLQVQQQKDLMQYQLDTHKAQNDLLKIQADVHKAQLQVAITEKKANTEIKAHEIDARMEHHDMQHRHALDKATFIHDHMQHKDKMEMEEKKHEQATKAALQRPKE